MELLLAAFSGVLLWATGVSGLSAQRVVEPPDLVFARAAAELELKGGLLVAVLGDEPGHFEVDMDAGSIAFTDASRVVTAPIQVIGTYNTLDGTFLWAWDHPFIPEALAIDAQVVRTFGRRHQLPLYTTRMVECTEGDAWGFTAVALYLSGAQAAYRAPYRTTIMFVTLGDLSVAPLE